MTEQNVRDHLAKQGYNAGDIDIILKHFVFDDLIEFNGMNCDDFGDDYCGGWDGISRRCSCGNRRVYWVVEGSFAYGEAY